MTVRVDISAAKTHLSKLVDEVASGGEPVIITRQGRAVARIVTIEAESGANDALALLLAAREASVSGEGTFRELINEGRRR